MFKRIALFWTILRTDAHYLWRALRHRSAPAWLKAGAALVLLYLISPIDLVPDVIPVFGVMDDLILVPLAIRFLLDRLPPNVSADVGRTRRI